MSYFKHTVYGLRYVFRLVGREDKAIRCLIYSAGLRISEVIKLRQADIDFDRMQIHIRCSKYKKDRYVPLAAYMVQGLKKHYAANNPKEWVFNGKAYGSPLSKRGVGWALRSALKKTNIQKKVCVHTLRHSYATHLLEDGLDLYSIQKLLGHEHVETTLVYLHVAQTLQKRAHSPLDTLYEHATQA